MSAQTFEQLRVAGDEALLRHDVEALQHCARELILLATPEATACAENLYGGAAQIVGDYQAAMVHYQRALELYETMGDRWRIATVVGNIGAIHQRIGDAKTALDHLERARVMHAEVADRNGEARVVSNIALVLQNTGAYDEALKHQHHALEMYSDLGDLSGVARVVGNIGIVYDVLGDLSNALEYYGRALAMHEERGDVRGIATTTNNIGLVYFRLGEYDKAAEQYLRALDLSERMGDRHGVALVNGNLVGVYRITGDYPKALELCHRSLAIYEDLGSQHGIAEIMTYIATVFAMTGAHAQALDHYQRALTVFEELGDPSGIAGATGNMGDVYFGMGDYRQALDLYSRAHAMDVELGHVIEAHNDMINVLLAHIAMGEISEAERILIDVDAQEILSPEARIAREQARAGICEHQGKISEATQILRAALVHAQENALPRDQMVLHERLRDLALKSNDLPAYVEHNTEFTQIREEINGKETATKLAMQEVERRIAAERQETAKHLAILHSTLPKHIADRVARGETVNDQHENAVVVFLDIVGFTTHSSEIDASVLVDHLQRMFTTFDALCAAHGVTKIKTIGDSYMAVAFPSDDHVLNAARVALDMSEQQFTWPDNGERVQCRIGMHLGPVVAGVLGTERLQYDVWGDTVNVASRMEGSGEPGRIHVSEAFATALQSVDGGRIGARCAVRGERHSRHPGESRDPDNDFFNNSVTNDTMTLLKRGEVSIKGKGPMTTYWLEGA